MCVDDYGLHEGIDEASIVLARQGRVSAISVMSQGCTWPDSAAALRAVHDPARLDVGLHLNLTEAMPGVAAEPLPRVILRSHLGLGSLDALRATVRRQLDRFEEAWGAPPAHVDGHQHVHQLPRVRSVLFDELQRRYPGQRPWLRASRRPPASADLPERRKAGIISALGAGALQRRADHEGWPCNRALLGVYGFDADAATYRRLLQRWCAAAQDGDLLMCHPATRTPADDVIGEARRTEFSVWNAAATPADLAHWGIVVEPLSRVLATPRSPGA